ncbi:UNVERIFIED_CONTAM: hypothetical protein PYX00_008598 [Menopon gallinae]|uniref:protein xylosyltransferase n=1 Tax=Menopon gallinae TaxID=328185 RepID=A0AAW2HNH2_9NEOP
MAVFKHRALDIRWLRKPRYRKFVVIVSILFSINVFLVCNLVSSYNDPAAGEEDPSGRGRYHLDGASLQDEEEGLDKNFIKQQKHHINLEKRILKQKQVPDNTNNKNYINSNKLNSAIKLNNATSLKLEELDFKPWCNIVTKEAISAIHRAKTQYCKSELVNVTCLLQRGDLFPKQLTSLCPAPGVTKGKSLGCFQDDKSMRILSGYFTNLEVTNSPQNCINLCLQSGFPYAGVEYWTECFCGVEEPSPKAKLPDSSCNMKCPADSRLVCGGYLTINIYETGILKFSPQVPSSNVPETEPRARITFLLTLSGRALRQIQRLIKSLYHKDHYFLIHVDATQDYLFRELLYLEKFLPNVKLMRKRHATMWAGSSLLQMILAAMKEILQMPWKWDFIVNLSESDFPIKKNEKLVDFLTANREKNFVKSTGREIQRFIQKQGLDKTFVQCDGHMWRIGDRTLPVGIQMDGGSDWMALSRPFVEYVASDTRDELLKGLDRVYQYTLLPAESYFHTVLRNSKFCDTYIDNNLHLTNWKRHLGCKCQYRHIVDWCGCSPNDFKPDDWKKIESTSSNQLFFARKFEPIINQAIINKLEEWVYGPPPKSANMLGYWQSIYHHADLTPPRDDSILTLTASLTRLVTKHNYQFLSISEKDILELSAYQHDDVFQGLLVRYKAKHRNESLQNQQFETWFKLRSHFKILDEKNGKFINNVQVTSDFDVKESTSRNLLGTLGLFSDVILVYTLSAEMRDNLTMLVIDPAGQLAQVVDIRVDEKSVSKTVTASVKAVIPVPLLPGIWHVKIYYEGFLVAVTKFLVIPLEFIAANAMTLQQASLLHRGSPEYRISVDKAHWAKSLENNLAKHSLALANQKRIGNDLREWIDSLVKQFYTPVETCKSSASSGNFKFIEPCEATIWSTLSPDLKSSISSYDSQTGLIS